MNKPLSVILAFCLLCLSLPLAAAEGTHVRTAKASFQPDRSTPVLGFDIPFDDSVFLQDSGTYSHTLCRMSLGMAVSAFRPANLADDQSAHIEDFLEDAGFTGMRIDQYGSNMDQNTIGSVIASKKIGTGDAAFTLVAVAVCGGGYRDEWLSNFKVGNVGDHSAILAHQGFYEAAQKIQRRADEYHSAIEGPVKFWFAGYSRGAAVANLSAAMLAGEGWIDPGDLFVYTFATPNNTRDPDAHSGLYKGFYSVVGMFDPVPKVPLASWGFTRYGTTLTLPSVVTDTNYSEYYTKACAWSMEHLNRPFFYSVFVNYTITKVLNALSALLPTATDYVETMQLRFMRLWSEKGNMLSVIALISEIYSQAVEDSSGIMLDYLLNESAWQGVLQWAGLGNLDISDQASSLVSNLAREHYPDTYASLLMSCGEELYAEHRGYCQITILPGVTLNAAQLNREKAGSGASARQMTVTANSADNPVWPIISFTSGSVLFLPAGEVYLLTLRSVPGSEESTAVLVQTVLDGENSPDPSMIVLDADRLSSDWTAMLDLRDQTPDELVFHSKGGLLRSTMDWSYLNTSLVDLIFIAQSGGDNLRTLLITAGVIFALLAVSLVLAAVWAVRGRTHRASVTLYIILSVLFVIIQLCYIFLPAQVGIRSVFRGLATATLFVQCLLCTLQKHSLRNFLVLAAFVFYTFCDVVLSQSLNAGLIAIIAGNVLLIAALSLGKKRRRIQYFALAAGLGIGAAILLPAMKHPDVQKHLPMIITHLAVLAVMLAAAVGHNRLIRIGAVLLSLSDLLIFHSMFNGVDWWTYLFILGLYYSATTLLAIGIRDGEKLPVRSLRSLIHLERRLKWKHLKQEFRKKKD